MSPEEIKHTVFLIELRAQLLRMAIELSREDLDFQRFMFRVVKPLPQEDL